MIQDLDRFYDLISAALTPQMDSVMDSISKSDSSRSVITFLPQENVADLSAQDVARLIAISSNKYAASCRLASMARANFKIAEARYKYKFRTSQGHGKNAGEREAAAYAASEAEYQNMTLAQVILELCEGIESANRIASESARRMLLAADQHQKADHRFNDNASHLKEADFQTY